MALLPRRAWRGGIITDSHGANASGAIGRRMIEQLFNAFRYDWLLERSGLGVPVPLYIGIIGSAANLDTIVLMIEPLPGLSQSW
jgi:hypothetical protein